MVNFLEVYVSHVFGSKKDQNTRILVVFIVFDTPCKFT